MAKPLQTNKTTPRGSDAGEYSAMTAREHREYVESMKVIRDSSLKPGGPFGAPMDVGMSSLDRATVPSEAGTTSGQTRYGEEPAKERRNSGKE